MDRRLRIVPGISVLLAGALVVEAGTRPRPRPPSPPALLPATTASGQLVQRLGPIPGRLWGSGAVPLRDSPGGRVIGSFPGLTPVQILGRVGSWYRVVHRMGSAYLPSDRVVTRPDGPLGTAGVYLTKVRGGGAVPVHGGPGGPVTGRLAGGTPLRIAGRTMSWILVETGDTVGFLPIARVQHGHRFDGWREARWGRVEGVAGPAGGTGGGGRTWGKTARPPVLASFEFPVRGDHRFRDDFGVGTHAFGASSFNVGIDIFAEAGSSVVSPVAGVVERTADTGIGGNAVFVIGSDGSTYYFAHLSQLAPRIESGRRLAAGEVLGYVGTTGNAEGGPPHLHFSAVRDGLPWNPYEVLRMTSTEASPRRLDPRPPGSAPGIEPEARP